MALQQKTEQQEKLNLKLADKIAKNTKEIKNVAGVDSESELDRDIIPEMDEVMEKEDDESEKNKEILNENNTNDDLFDQTFLKPSDGLTCKDCSFIAQNKIGLKKHRKAKHN